MFENELTHYNSLAGLFCFIYLFIFLTTTSTAQVLLLTVLKFCIFLPRGLTSSLAQNCHTASSFLSLKNSAPPPKQKQPNLGMSYCATQLRGETGMRCAGNVISADVHGNVQCVLYALSANLMSDLKMPFHFQLLSLFFQKASSSQSII